MVIAPDSFKDSLTAQEAAHAMETGVRAVIPDADLVILPMADGGEGTVRALVASTGGQMETCKVTGPLGNPVNARFGWLGDGETAVIEMAAASGLELVPADKRNPLHTTTYGTGELIRAALDKGCKKLIVGIGGSATTDCGTGMAQALGVRFYNNQHQEITEPMTGGLMGTVTGIDISELHPQISTCNIQVACDVTNPLLGAQGAAHVYCPLSVFS